MHQTLVRATVHKGTQEWGRGAPLKTKDQGLTGTYIAETIVFLQIYNNLAATAIISVICCCLEHVIKKGHNFYKYSPTRSQRVKS